MTAPSRLRSIALLASLVLAATPALGDELTAAIRPHGLRIHDASETLRSYCAWRDGVLWFTAPGGTSWELVTSTGDPAISNPGDGEFHPFDPTQVQRAIEGMRYPLQRVAAEIFILPYPRRLGLESAAGPGLIVLSPGVRERTAETQQSEFVHELGHVVQYTLMPDTDTEQWERYRELRGIVDESVYDASAPHAYRPHEIFAEDFRALFGPVAANTAGTIENDALVYPTAVSGLQDFMVALAGAAPRPGALVLVGDASRGEAHFARPGWSPALLDLYDVTGRRIASVAPQSDANGSAWTWNGRDAAGQSVRGAVVFARVRDGRGGTTRLVRLP